ncbi:MAG: Gfo/Idh/MocA family oxidoreductase [Firmicutes bacterium]|nr:Gfo/Idh/MocA family oxidoreductase [Bacillota bacterium]
MSIKVGIIGMGFGKEFIAIYQKLTGCEVKALSQRNEKKLNEIADTFGIEHRYTNWKQMLNDKDIDAIHVVSPILDHVEMTVASLNAGKHTACTVPMGTSIDDLKRIIAAKKKSGKVYMMMETAVYTREYLLCKKLLQEGKIGRIQFVRGSHIQDMGLKGWPDYWLGFPPMHYGTHAISPLLDITNDIPEYVICHGSGSINAERTAKYGSPFAVETATFRLKNTRLAAEATRALYETVRQYRESFDVYGDKISFEWEQLADEGHVLFKGGEEAERLDVPDTDDLLPPEIQEFTKRNHIMDKSHVSFIQGAGHGGSHPHMVYEFISAIKEGRNSAIDAVKAAYWTGAGICAHESAMKSGEKIRIPDFQAYYDSL